MDTDTGQIAICDVVPQTVKYLDHFVYMKNLNIAKENVQFGTTQFLQLAQVRDMCVKFLPGTAEFNNIVQVCTFVHSLKNLNLIESFDGYRKNSVIDLSKNESFPKLLYSIIKKFVSQGDMNKLGEEEICSAAMNWMKILACEQQDVLPEVLNDICMIYVFLDFLITRAVSNKLVRAPKPGSDLKNEIKNCSLSPKQASFFQNVKPAAHKNLGMNNFLYSICKVQGSEKISVHRCSLVNKTWQNIASLKLNEDSGYVCSAVAVNDKIYIFLKETIQTFHMKTHQWEKLESKHRDIWGSASLSFGNGIYCFSSVHSRFSDKVRCFRTEQNKWMNEDLMKAGRFYVAVASMEKYIYVSGGLQNGQIQSTVEKYDATMGQWTEISSMLLPRYLHASTSANGKIYVCGGRAPRDYLGAAEVYDPLTNMWNPISSMKIPRARFSLISQNGRIYALGGITRDGNIRDVEIYNLKTDKWKSSTEVPEGYQCALLGPGASI